MKKFLIKNSTSIAIGLVAGLVLSFVFYPEPRTEIIMEEVPVYIETIKEVPVYIAVKEAEEIKLSYLGEFELTAYCACSKCCGKANGITATGTIATANRTIAVDPKIIKYGTKVVINGQEYVAEDCGGNVKGNVIDIFFDKHEEAVKFGKQKASVYVYLEDKE